MRSNFEALKEHVYAVYKEEIWRIPQEKIELLIFEKIILMPLIKNKLLSENLRKRVKKGAFTQLKGACYQS